MTPSKRLVVAAAPSMTGLTMLLGTALKTPPTAPATPDLSPEAAASGDRSGVAGAVGGVLRAVPSNMVRPVILGAAATTNLLDGVKNQISPDQRVEEEEKWKTYSER